MDDESENGLDKFDQLSYSSSLSSAHADAEQVIEEAKPEIVAPVYTDEDLEALVLAIKKMVFLYKHSFDDWTERASMMIRYWLTHPDEDLLAVYYDGVALTASLHIPKNPVFDMTYFMREPQQIFTKDGFHDEISFGTLSNDILGCLDLTVKKVYNPILLGTMNITSNVKHEFCVAMNKFLSYLTSMHSKLSGNSILFIPDEIRDTASNDDAEFQLIVKRLELISSDWISDIRMTLSDKMQMIPGKLLCLTDEFDFWDYKCEVLMGLHQQFSEPDFLAIIKILDNAECVSVKTLYALMEEVDAELKIATTNRTFLQLLIKPCFLLESIDKMEDIPDRVPDIMHLIRVISIHSGTFTSDDDISRLFKYLTNQVISLFMRNFDVKKIFNGFPRLGVSIAEKCIDCCWMYKLTFKKIHTFHVERSKSPWNLNESIIFNHLDIFLRRLNDLIEICKAMIIFGRIDDSGKAITLLSFGTNRGPEFDQTCKDIEVTFKQELENLQQSATKKILNVFDNSWAADIAEYRRLIQSLDKTVQNLITNLFMDIKNVEEGTEALYSLYHFYPRLTLAPAIVEKINYVWKMFSLEVADLRKTDFKDRPSILSDYSGPAIIQKAVLSRVRRIKAIFDEMKWLPITTQTIQSKDLCDNVMTIAEEFITNSHQLWLGQYKTNVSTILTRTLINRSVTHLGFLECNIDRSLLPLLNEAFCFEMFKLPLPLHVSVIYAKRNILQAMYQSIISMTLDYNRILSTITAQERQLFKKLISQCDRKVLPGIFKLNWGGDMAEAYIEECTKHALHLQQFIQLYKVCNRNVFNICDKMGEVSLLKIDVDEPISLNELVEDVRLNRQKVIFKLGEMYNEITNMVAIINEKFLKQCDPLPDEWADYIHMFDLKIENVLIESAKLSLREWQLSLHGDDRTIQAKKIVAVELSLVDKDLRFSPQINKIAEYFETIDRDVVYSYRHFKRFFEKFKDGPVVDGLQPFYRIIRSNADVNNLKKIIDEEVAVFLRNMNDYLARWMVFKEMWLIDENEFMKRYKETHTLTADKFIRNIRRFYEIANQVAEMENSIVINFIVINALPLKHSVLFHIEKWHSQYKDCARDIFYERLKDILSYIETNHGVLMQLAPETAVELERAFDVYHDFEHDVEQKSEEIQTILDLYDALGEYNICMSIKMKGITHSLRLNWISYKNKLDEVSEALDQKKEQLDFAEEAEKNK